MGLREKLPGTVLEGSSVLVEIFKPIASLAPVPCLESSLALLCSILRAVEKARENLELCQALAARTGQVVGSIYLALDGIEVDERQKNNIRQLDRLLEDVLSFVEKQRKRLFISHIFLPNKTSCEIAWLERRLDDTVQIFQVRSILSTDSKVTRVELQLKQVEDILDQLLKKIEASNEPPLYQEQESSDGLDIISPKDINTREELLIASGHRIYSAEVKGKVAIVKEFRGPTARERWISTARAHNRVVLHPNFLRILGTSRDSHRGDGASEPYLVFSSCYDAQAEMFMASALRSDLRTSTLLGIQLIRDLSSAFNYLQDRKLPLYSMESESFELFVQSNGQDDAKFIIGFNTCNHLERERPSDDNDGAIDMFSGLCRKTFNSATWILYQEQLEREGAAPTPTVFPDTMAAGSANTTPHSPQPEASPASTSAPRREFVWSRQESRLLTLGEVAQQSKNFLESQRIKSSGGHVLRQLVSSDATQTRHRCKGYKREEIVLSPAIAQSAVVFYSSPSVLETCLICGETVQEPSGDRGTNAVGVDGDEMADEDELTGSMRRGSDATVVEDPAAKSAYAMRDMETASDSSTDALLREEFLSDLRSRLGRKRKGLSPTNPTRKFSDDPSAPAVYKESAGPPNYSKKMPATDPDNGPAKLAKPIFSPLASSSGKKRSYSRPHAEPRTGFAQPIASNVRRIVLKNLGLSS